MNMLQQNQLRELAQQQAHVPENPEQQALAQGTLELLRYVDELVHELECTTEACCEAMCAVYEYGAE